MLKDAARDLVDSVKICIIYLRNFSPQQAMSVHKVRVFLKSTCKNDHDIG